jgi:hypothetical protein
MRYFAGVTNIQQLGVGVDNPATAVDIDGHLTLSMQAEPADPAVDKGVIWVADGELPPFSKGALVMKQNQIVNDSTTGGVDQERVTDHIFSIVTGFNVLLTDEFGNHIVCASTDPDDAGAFIAADYEGGD